MKHQYVKRIFKNPFYVNLKKHRCPVCRSQLMKIKVSQIVNFSSEETANFDFEFVDTYMIGNVKLIWTEFKCLQCGKQISIEEMKQIEKRVRLKQ